MNSASPFVYDQVLYDGNPIAQTHPNRIAPLATILGMSPALAENCRVLELGCGDGTNVLPMAALLPNSHFTGIDLAKIPVEKAIATAQALGLTNIRFHHMNLLDIDATFGEFDYIVAHGVYSWVPPNVQDKLLSVCRSHLSPNGVAYVSYNVYPGCHVRDMLRGMMLYHNEDVGEPHEKIRKAGELLTFLTAGKPDSPALADELKQLNSRKPSSLLHDDMSDENHPVYFHQFARHAGEHGLQFLAEADYFEMQPYNFAQDVRERLTAFSNDDLIRQEQYLDFLKCRRFRKTLLCRQEVPLTRIPASDPIRDFYLASAAHPVSDNPEIDSDKEEAFRGLKGGALRTTHRALKAAIIRLGMQWPASIGFQALLEAVGVYLEDLSSETVDLFRQMLLRCYAAGLLELSSSPSKFTLTVSGRPLAFPYARLQARNGESAITNLKHTTTELDTPGLELLAMLDGTRTVASIHRELMNDGLTARPGVPPTPAAVHDIIAKMARAALLVS